MKHPKPYVCLNLFRLKDGCKVIPTGRYVLQNFHDDIFSLLIKDVKTSDGGCYKCVAKNEYGEASTQALLSVLGKSALPEVHVLSSNTRGTVTSKMNTVSGTVLVYRKLPCIDIVRDSVCIAYCPI